jgi:drug/metabolite transporter (DMT)-like permease
MAASDSPPKLGAVEWALLLLLAVLWGGSFFFSKFALRELPPAIIVLCRITLGALALNVAVLVSGHRMPRSLEAWRAFAVLGALNCFLPFTLITWSQTAITSALASILNATTPLLTIVVAHFLTRDERMTPGKLAGVLIGFAGAALMVGPEALGGMTGSFVGELACLAGALSYAFGGVYGRRMRRMGISPLCSAAGQFTTASAMVLAVVAVRGDLIVPAAAPSPLTWGAVLCLALISTALAYVIYFRILATAGATNAILVTFLVPVSAILLGTTILGERLTAWHVAGMGLVALGLAAIDGRPWLALRTALRRAPLHARLDES